MSDYKDEETRREDIEDMRLDKIAELIQTLIVADRDMVAILSDKNNTDIRSRMNGFTSASRRFEAAKRELRNLGVPVE
jgi:hypothetical protein